MEDEVLTAVRQFAKSINFRKNAVVDISPLVAATSRLPLNKLDYWERLIRSEFSRSLDATPRPRWRLWSKPNSMLTWLDLISWDGYRREKTLRTLSGSAPNTFFFSLALRRLNDWVPQVRAAAREKLPEMAKATDPVHVVEALSIVLSNWNSWGRIEEAEKQTLFEIISEEGVAVLLRSMLISSTSGPMPSLFSQLGRTSILDGYVDDIAIRSVQPSVRAKAYRSLFEGRIAWIEGRKWEWTDIRYCEGRLKPIVSERSIEVRTPILEILRASADDKSSIVRRVSAEILIRELESLGESARKFAETFVLDESNSVSERGRFALNKLDGSESVDV